MLTMLKRILPFLLVLLVIDLLAMQAFITAGMPVIASGVLIFGASIVELVTFVVYFRGVRSGNRHWLMMLFFTLLLPKLLIAVLLLGEDIYRLCALVINGVSALAGAENLLATTRSFGWSVFSLGFGGLITGLFIYGAMFNVYRYKIHKVNVRLLRLPESFSGLRIVQISDIHSGSLSNRHAIQQAVDRINALGPDIIFFTGDLVNNIASEAVSFIDIFSQLRARHGVFSILGNHDYGDYMVWPSAQAREENLENLKSVHERMGWRLLLNEHVHIERSGEKIIIAGVENWSARGRFASYGDLNATLQGVAPDAPIFLLSHDPSHWEGEILNHPAQVDITFSGHTHGMQFGFEWLKIRWSPVKYLYRQWAGLYTRSRQYLYVNRGFGVIGYPGRVGILPEITLFTIQKESL